MEVAFVPGLAILTFAAGSMYKSSTVGRGNGMLINRNIRPVVIVDEAVAVWRL